MLFFSTSNHIYFLFYLYKIKLNPIKFTVVMFSVKSNQDFYVAAEKYMAAQSTDQKKKIAQHKTQTLQNFVAIIPCDFYFFTFVISHIWRVWLAKLSILSPHTHTLIVGFARCASLSLIMITDSSTKYTCSVSTCVRVPANMCVPCVLRVCVGGKHSSMLNRANCIYEYDRRDLP